MFHCFFPQVFVHHSAFFFSFLLWLTETTKSTRSVLFFFVSFSLLIRPISGFLAEIMWSVFILKSQKILSVSFSWTDDRLSIYHLLVWSKLQSLPQFAVDHLPHSVVSSLILFLRYSALSLIMWLIISSLKPHNLHQLFFCILPILSRTSFPQ